MKTYSSILPGAVLLLAAALFLRYAPQWDSFSAFVGIYPYVVWVAGVLLGWRFNRSRLVFAVLVLALGDQALLRYFPAGSGGGHLQPGRFWRRRLSSPHKSCGYLIDHRARLRDSQGIGPPGTDLDPTGSGCMDHSPRAGGKGKLAGSANFRDRCHRLDAAASAGASGIRGGLYSTGGTLSSPSKRHRKRICLGDGCGVFRFACG